MGNSNSHKIRSRVDSDISKHPVIMYSTTYCGYCKKAESLFKLLKVKPFVIYLDKDGDGDEISEVLEEMTKQDTVPNIFIGGKHIGGFSNLQESLEKGVLKEEFKRIGIDIVVN